MKFLVFPLLFCFCFCNGNLLAQKQYGVAVMPVMMHPMDLEETGIPVKKIMPGIRVEYLKTQLGIERFRYAYFGFALSWFPPTKVDITVPAIKTGSTSNTTLYPFPGKKIESGIDGIFKFGFEVPQHWSDFLFLNIGLGLGLARTKVKYDLPGYDSQKYYFAFNYNSDLAAQGVQAVTDEFVSVFYEFSKYYIFTQVDLTSNYSINVLRFSTRLNAGIYYKLNSED
jgi:hypothetical protein